MEEKDKAKAKTLGRVAELIVRCPNFDGFDWDWCQDNCPMYLICGAASDVHDVGTLTKKSVVERIRGALRRG